MNHNPLTKETIRALRQAKVIDINFRGRLTGTQVCLDLTNHHILPPLVFPTEYRDYAETTPRAENPHGHFHKNKNDSDWQAFLALLRVGARVVFRWYRDNSNGHMRDAGLCCDTVEAVVVRGGVQLAVHMKSVVTKPHSSARLILES